MKAGPVGSWDYGENDQRWEQDMSTEEDLMKDFSLRRVWNLKMSSLFYLTVLIRATCS